MADTFQKILESELFTFLVGKERKAIIVHSAAITEHSKVLRALATNGMVESQARTATLEDVREDDFVRFCQFAYTSDYSTPPYTEEEIPKMEPEISEEPCPPPPPAPEAPIDEEWGYFVKKSKKGKKGVSSAASKSAKVWKAWGVDVTQVTYQDLKTLRTNFENRVLCKQLPRQKLLDSCEPVSNSAPNYNFAPVFLAHARLYVFADRYQIEPLKNLVLQKLHQTLVRFELYPERVKDIVELARFAYSDDNTFGGGADELRALVAVYAASRIDKLNMSDSFLTLLEDGGAFVKDFWLLVRNAVYV